MQPQADTFDVRCVVAPAGSCVVLYVMPIHSCHVLMANNGEQGASTDLMLLKLDGRTILQYYLRGACGHAHSIQL